MGSVMPWECGPRRPLLLLDASHRCYSNSDRNKSEEVHPPSPSSNSPWRVHPWSESAKGSGKCDLHLPGPWVTGKHSVKEGNWNQETLGKWRHNGCNVRKFEQSDFFFSTCRCFKWLCCKLIMHFLEFKSLREAMVQSEIQEGILNWWWFILAMGSDDNWARR